jgi:ribulose bisphosphate carboxylase small subunit
MNSRRRILRPKTQIQSDRTLNLNRTLEQGMIRGQEYKDCPSVATHYFNAVMSPVRH